MSTKGEADWVLDGASGSLAMVHWLVYVIAVLFFVPSAWSYLHADFIAGSLYFFLGAVAALFAWACGRLSRALIRRSRAGTMIAMLGGFALCIGFVFGALNPSNYHVHELHVAIASIVWAIAMLFWAVLLFRHFPPTEQP